MYYRAPALTRDRLGEVQAFPFGEPIEMGGKWFAFLHIQYRLEGGNGYFSADVILVITSPEGWAIECAGFNNLNPSFSGSGRSYNKATRGADGGWYLTQEEVTELQPRFCLIREGKVEDVAL